MRNDLSTATDDLTVTAKRPALAGRQPPAPRPRLAQWAHDAPRLTLALTLLALCVTFAPMRPGVTTYLLSAAQARAAQRYDLALALYAEAHTANTADARPLCASGDVYTLQGETKAAIAAYRACVTLAPSDGSAWLRLGDALASANDDAAAVSAWQRGGAAGDVTAYYRLAERATALGQFDEAARWWAKAPNDDIQAQSHLGLLALAQGDVVAARAHLIVANGASGAFASQLRAAGVYQLVLRPPTSAADEVNIGYALLTLGEPTLALAPLRRAVQLAPTNGAARAYYGWALWALGQTSAARPQIAAGVHYDPALPFALYAAGEVALADGQAGEALARFETALEVSPHNPALWSAAGDAALARVDYVTARLSYANAAQNSDDPAYTISLVRFYLDHGLGASDGSAIQAAIAATQRFPKNETLAFLLGRLYLSQSNKIDAFYAFTTAASLDPTDPGPWFYLGTYNASVGNVVPAVVDLRTALALQPTGPYAKQARSALASYSGDTL
ncbi:MAG TPA: tetratricopeptide repeat protein [Ktedonobacterales bacterium]